MALDLSGLDSFAGFHDDQGKSGLAGASQAIEIALIDEDPNNPRTDMDKSALSELASSIKTRGVKSPVSLRAHPDTPGRFILNYGHRRLRASRLAGHETIPAFIDEDHDEFDQVVENIQREALSPIDTARFIQKMVDSGMAKSQIAQMLGKPNSYVSDHAAFFALSDDIRGLYDQGTCTSVRVLAMLQRAYKTWPEEITKYCRTGKDFTANAVNVLTKRLKEQDQAAAEPSAPSDDYDDATQRQSSDEQLATPDDRASGLGEQNSEEVLPDAPVSQVASEAQEVSFSPDLARKRNQSEHSGVSSDLVNPIIAVSVDGRNGELVYRESVGQEVLVKFEDADVPEAVASGLVVIEKVMPR